MVMTKRPLTGKQEQQSLKANVIFLDISDFAICHVERHGNVNIQNSSTVTNPTMEPYFCHLRCRAVQLDKSQTHCYHAYAACSVNLS